jgi:four helix bundle protein
MGTVTRFEDLVGWQKARALTKQNYLITWRGEFARNHRLSKQIRRAAASVVSNIAECFERGNRTEFNRYLFRAKASCAELRCQLYVAFDIGYVDQGSLDALLTQAEKAARIIGGLRAAVLRPNKSSRQRSQ